MLGNLVSYRSYTSTKKKDPLLPVTADGVSCEAATWISAKQWVHLSYSYPRGWGPGCLLTSSHPTLDVFRFDARLTTTRIFFFLNGPNFHINKNQKSVPSLFGQAAAVKNFKNTTTRWPEEDGDRGTDYRGGKNPFVSKCSNTDVMKWIQIQ